MPFPILDRARGGPRARGRIVELRAADGLAGGVHPGHHEDLAVRQERGRVGGAHLRHRARVGPRIRDGIRRFSLEPITHSSNSPAATRIRPSGRSVAVWRSRGVRSGAASVHVHPRRGRRFSTTSVTPPATTTLPSGRSVAVWPVCGVLIGATSTHVFVSGSYTSAVALAPPATRTFPSSKRVAVCLLRATFIGGAMSQRGAVSAATAAPMPCSFTRLRGISAPSHPSAAASGATRRTGAKRCKNEAERMLDDSNLDVLSCQKKWAPP